MLYLLSVGTAGQPAADEFTMRWTATTFAQNKRAEALLTGVSAGDVLLTWFAIAAVTGVTRG